MHPFESSALAETAFYDAFERGDLNAMRGVWADDGGVCCIHPGGERLEGTAAVMTSWAAILSGQPGIRFHLTGLHIHTSGDLAVHMLKEHLYMLGTLRGVALATNVYRRDGNGWRMILHHASPDLGRGRSDTAKPGGVH